MFLLEVITDYEIAIAEIFNTSYQFIWISDVVLFTLLNFVSLLEKLKWNSNSVVQDQFIMHIIIRLKPLETQSHQSWSSYFIFFMQQQFQIDESQNKNVFIHSANHILGCTTIIQIIAVSSFVITLKLGCD